MANFEQAIPKIFKYEGGYANDPLDPGGETNFGIAKRAFPNVDIKNLTKEKAGELYRERYWNAMRLNEVNSQALAEEMLDIGVNMGPEIAVRLAQLAYNLLSKEDLHVDGKIGPVTLGALNGSLYPNALVKTLNGLQFYRYIKIIETDPRKEKF